MNRAPGILDNLYNGPCFMLIHTKLCTFDIVIIMTVFVIWNVFCVHISCSSYI